MNSLAASGRCATTAASICTQQYRPRTVSMALDARSTSAPRANLASEASLSEFWDVDAGRASTWFSTACFTGTLISHALLVAPKLEDIPGVGTINDSDTIILALMVLVASLPLTAVLSLASFTDESSRQSSRAAERRLLQASLHHALLWQCITLIYSLLALLLFAHSAELGLVITPQLADAVCGVMWASMADVVARAIVLLIPHGYTQQRNIAIWMSVNQVAYSVSPLLGELVDVRVEFFAICAAVTMVAPCLGVVLAGKSCTRALKLPDTWLVPDVPAQAPKENTPQPWRCCGCRFFRVCVFSQWFELPAPSTSLPRRLLEAGRRYTGSFAASIVLTAIGGGALNFYTLYDLGCAISNSPGGFGSSTLLPGHSSEVLAAYETCGTLRTSFSGTSITLRAIILASGIILAQLLSIVSVVVRVSTLMLLANQDQADQQARSTAMLRWLSHECRSPIGVAQLIVDSVRRETLVLLKQAHGEWHKNALEAEAAQAQDSNHGAPGNWGQGREVTHVQEQPSSDILLAGAPSLSGQRLPPAPRPSADALKQRSRELLRSLERDTLAISQPLSMLGGVLDNMLVYLRTSALQDSEGGGRGRKATARFMCAGAVLHDFGAMVPPLVASFDAPLPRMTGHGMVVLGSEHVYASAPRNRDPLAGLVRALLPTYTPVSRSTVIQVLINLFTNALKYGVTPPDGPHGGGDVGGVHPARTISGAAAGREARLEHSCEHSIKPLGIADLHLGIALVVHGPGVPKGWDASELRGVLGATIGTAASNGASASNRQNTPQEHRSRSTSPPTARSKAQSGTMPPPVVRDALDEQILTCCTVITLTDKGRGMTTEEVNSLFQPFSRLRSGTQQKGTGLGLWLMRELLHSQGGELTVRSAGRNKGCTFALSIPSLVAKEDVQGFIREVCGPPATLTAFPSAAQEARSEQGGGAAMQQRGGRGPSGADEVAMSTPPRTATHGRRRGRGTRTAMVSPAPRLHPPTACVDMSKFDLPGEQKRIAPGLVQALMDAAACGASAFLEIAKLQLASVSSSGASSGSLNTPADITRQSTGTPVTVTTHLLSQGALRLLVVDDSSALRKQLSRSLRRLGCQVLQAADGEAALLLLRSLPPHERVHGVVCDMSMPAMDGPTFVEHVRNLEASGSVLSALPQELMHRRKVIAAAHTPPPGRSIGGGSADSALLHGGSLGNSVLNLQHSTSGNRNIPMAPGTRLTSVPEGATSGGQWVTPEQYDTEQRTALQHGASTALNLTSPLLLSQDTPEGTLEVQTATAAQRQGVVPMLSSHSDGGVPADRDPARMMYSPSNGLMGGTVSIRDFTRQPSRLPLPSDEPPPSVLLRGGTGYVAGGSETSAVENTATVGDKVALGSASPEKLAAGEHHSDEDSVGSAHSALVVAAQGGEGGFDGELVGANALTQPGGVGQAQGPQPKRLQRQLAPLSGVGGASFAKPPASPFSGRSKGQDGRRLFSSPMSSPSKGGQRRPIGLDGGDSLIEEEAMEGGAQTGKGGADSIVSASQSIRYQGDTAASPVDPAGARFTRGRPTEGGGGSVLSAGSGARLGGEGGVMWRGDSFGPQSLQAVRTGSYAGSSGGGIAAPFASTAPPPSTWRVSGGSPLVSPARAVDGSGQRHPITLRQTSAVSEVSGPDAAIAHGPMMASHSLAASGVSLATSPEQQGGGLGKTGGGTTDTDPAARASHPVRLTERYSNLPTSSSHHAVVSLPSDATNSPSSSAPRQPSAQRLGSAGSGSSHSDQGGQSAHSGDSLVQPSLLPEHVSATMCPGVAQQVEAILASMAPSEKQGGGSGPINPPSGGWKGLPISRGGAPLWQPHHFHDTEGTLPMSRLQHPTRGMAGSGRVESAPRMGPGGRRLGWKPSRLPVIGLTGNALEEDMRVFLDAGADTVLTKPLAAENILMELHSMTRVLHMDSTAGSDGGFSEADRPPPDSLGPGTGALALRHTASPGASSTPVARRAQGGEGGGDQDSLQYSEGAISDQADSRRLKTLDGSERAAEAISARGSESIANALDSTSGDVRSQSVHTQSSGGPELLLPAEAAVQHALLSVQVG